MIPKAAVALLPILAAELAIIWPDFRPPEVFAGQAEQESNWNPRAELKTSREYGFGISQLTIAYNADGSVRFNSFEEAKKNFRELKGWRWEERFDARYQLRALVLMDRRCWIGTPWARDGYQRTALMLVCFNSGAGGIAKDRQLCRETPGCAPDLWFDNVERQSLKSRIRVAGYGKSFFEISREYPRRIMFERAPRYKGAI